MSVFRSYVSEHTYDFYSLHLRRQFLRPLPRMEALPPLCHPERSRGICSSADLSWECFSTEESWAYLLFSNHSPCKRPPPFCHPERSREPALSEVERGSSVLSTSIDANRSPVLPFYCEAGCAGSS